MKHTTIRAKTHNWARLAQELNLLQTRGSGAGRDPSISQVIEAFNHAMENKEFFDSMVELMKK